MSEKETAVLAREKWDELFKGLKMQWETMWLERYDDRVKAEGVARLDYSLLFVSRGTVVVTTRRCKAPDFVEIVEQQRELSGVEPSSGYVNPSVGGWGKFIRSTLSTRSRLSTLGVQVTPSNVQFWTIAVPVMIAFVAILSIGGWIGWTMATTPPPKPIDEVTPDSKEEKTTQN